MSSTTFDEEKLPEPRPKSLGIVQLRHHETNEVILVPTPSNDPNDPLNWSAIQKYYLAGLICLGVFLVNFVAAGPAVAIELITIDFFGDNSQLLSNISKLAYTQTVCSLMIGVGNLVWVPLAIKYGRRPVYIVTFLIMTGTCIWCAVATSFQSMLAARTIFGFAGAGPEIVAPLILADIFFLHERGAVMVLYTCSLTCGVGAGIVISGLVTMHHSWRMIYWMCTAFVGFSSLLVVLTLPETHYRRQAAVQNFDQPEKETVQMEEDVTGTAPSLPPKRTWLQSLRVFSSSYTQESLFTLASRPVIAFALPAVLWASLINSVTIGMIVAISTNFSSAFSSVYGFETWKSGLTYISAIIGALIAIFSGGKLSDQVADRLTVKNGGVRTPEMRLPTLIVSLITGPLSCILYGVGIGKALHWICPVFGIGLVAFTIVQSNNVSLVYIMDSYRPISGEVVVTQAVFKSAFGFLISFYTNPWVQKSGYIEAFGILAGISGAVFICFVPFYLWGDYLRTSSWKWGFVKKFLHWNVDREVGE